MWYIIALFVILAGVLYTCCNNKVKSKDDKEINELNIGLNSGITNPTDTIQPMYSKKDIEAKLKKLSETPKPEITSFGADCYAKVMPPDTAAYFCPTCGNKTLYKMGEGRFGAVRIVQEDIHACRSEVSQVKGISIKLDESQCCKECSPDVEEPRLCLLVSIVNTNDTTKIEGVDQMDIRLLAEFLDGKLKHKDNYDFETPLVNHIERIQALLGVKLK